MTIYQWMYNSLYERGMFKADAETILEILKPKLEESDVSMHQRWNDDINDYPMPLKAIWSLWLDRSALEWIDENCPQHWARPMFLPKKEREEFFEKAGV